MDSYHHALLSHPCLEVASWGRSATIRDGGGYLMGNCAGHKPFPFLRKYFERLKK